MIGIYKIINLINNKVYVGSAIDIKIRWRNHKYCLKHNKHNNPHLQGAWNKHGEQNFIFEQIESILFKEKEYILEREQYWLDHYQSYNPEFGYNICKIAGSTMGIIYSEETKQLLREANLGKHHTKETKKIMSEAKQGEKHSFFGKHHSEETKQKIREAKLGKYLSEEHKRNISKSLEGRICKEETKQLLREANLGENNPMYGKDKSGENSSSVKLTWVQVREIREKWKTSEYTQKQLAQEYNVSEGCICGIIYYKTWKKEIFKIIMESVNV